MGVLLSLLSLLLIAAGGGLYHGVVAVITEQTTVSYYSTPSEVLAYWRMMLPNSPLPLAILEHLSTNADCEKTTLQRRLHAKSDDEKFTNAKESHWKTTLESEEPTKEDNNKISIEWGARSKEDDHVTLGWAARIKEDDDKISMEWGAGSKEDDHVTLGWAARIKEDNDKITMEWGARSKEDDHVTLGWGARIKEDDDKISMEWGARSKEDDHVTLGWGARIKEDDDKISMEWGTRSKDDDLKTKLGWKTHMKVDDVKISTGWGPHSKDDDLETKLGWRTHMKVDDVKISTGWGPHSKDDEKKYEEEAILHGSPGNREEANHKQHDHINLANFLFSEHILTPGATLTPYIESSASPGPFLRRDVADSIPLSTKNFNNVLSMFAPASLSMAGKIWSTLHTCEHPHPVEGEQQACATSMESMVELAASVLGTPDLRAFSSSADVPAAGITSRSSAYTAAAVREVTVPAGAPATTMTCHGMAFPYAVFYCHAVNPTRVYEVTLRSSVEDDGATPMRTMQALVVCHLDTSRFDPENPFFVARGLKPGDAAVCHFLSRDSVLWAPAASSATAQGNVATQ